MIKWYLGMVALMVTSGAIAVIMNILIERQAREMMEALREPSGPEPFDEEVYTGALFDCPECNLAAEVASHVTLLDPDTGHTSTYVVINCPSDHDLITVTEDWFVDHVLSKNQ